MSPLARRVLLTVAFCPALLLLAALTLAVGEVVDTSPSFYIAPLLMIAILCWGAFLGGLVLWGRAVVWRPYRVALTGLLALLLLGGSAVPLLLALIQPPASRGFVSFSPFFLIAQFLCLPLLALTPTLLALFWRPTKAELTATMSGQTATMHNLRRFRMTRTVSRLLLSIGLLPLAALALALLVFVTEIAPGLDSDIQMIISVAGTLLLAMGYWLLIWVGGVRWTGRRAVLTVLTLVAALGVGVLVGLFAGGAGMLFDGSGSFQENIAVPFGALAAGVAWLIFTPLAWRETAAERRHREQRETAGYNGSLFCVTCGYSMAGLSQARCPECGAEYTLESLVAANAARVHPDRALEC